MELEVLVLVGRLGYASPPRADAKVLGAEQQPAVTPHSALRRSGSLQAVTALWREDLILTHHLVSGEGKLIDNYSEGERYP